MRSKTVDTPISKLFVEIGTYLGVIPAAAITAAAVNFKTEKAAFFKLGHFLNANHDGSGTLAGVNRQAYIDGVALYTQVEFAAAAQQYVHAVTRDERIRFIGPGFHTYSVTLSSSVANIYNMQEGYISVQEL